MWEYNYTMNTDELYHYGVLGMKWGVRRYQNADGTLTDTGKKKAAKMKQKYTALTGKQLRRNPARKPKNQNGDSVVQKPQQKRTIKDLSDDELKQKINRLRAEKDYMDLSRQVAAMNPKQVSAGRRFLSEVGGKVIAPALTEAGKKVFQEFVTKQATEALGLKSEDSMAALKKKAEKMKYEKEIATYEDYFAKRKNKTKNK